MDFITERALLLMLIGSALTLAFQFSPPVSQRETPQRLWTLAFAVFVIWQAIGLLPEYAFGIWLPLVNSICLIVIVWSLLGGNRAQYGFRALPNALLITAASLVLIATIFSLVSRNPQVIDIVLPTAIAAIILLQLPRPTDPQIFDTKVQRGISVLWLLLAATLMLMGLSSALNISEPNHPVALLTVLLTHTALPGLLIALGVYALLSVIDNASSHLKIQAMTDQLTQVPNLPGFEIAATRALALATRKQTPTCVVAADIDHFKSINDDYGHKVGDTVIEAFARTLMAQIRGTDIIGRVGGEEFIILMQDTNLRTCQEVTERLRSTVEKHSVQHDNTVLEITASFGIARVANHTDLQKAIREAEIALSAAKESGRNQTAVFGV